MLVKTQAATELPAVEIDHLPEGGLYVRIHRNLVRIVSEEGTAYEYDEVNFKTDRDLDEETANTDDWWEYGKTWTPDAQAPSVEDRLANLEDAMMALLMF